MSKFQQLSRILLAGATLALATLHPAAHARSDVGVSVSINQPGFYGRVDIGDQPRQLVYPQPVLIQQTPYAMVQQPIYLRVPPGHYKRWGTYCGRYRACGQRVYFVQPQPVVVAPGYGPRHIEHRHGHRHDRHDHRRDRRDRHDRHHHHHHGR